MISEERAVEREREAFTKAWKEVVEVLANSDISDLDKFLWYEEVYLKNHLDKEYPDPETNV